jgi:hypothetical protein
MDTQIAEDRSVCPNERGEEDDTLGPVVDNKQVEQSEEEKLKSKYPSLAKRGGGSALLNKRLHKGGQKYFDSGDYAMAKAKLSGKSKPPPPPEKIIKSEDVGMEIPTPQNIQARKPSLVASKLAAEELM